MIVSAQSSLPDPRKWYVLYTRPRHEKKLALLFTRSGVQHYLPLKRVKKKWSDRVKFVEEPLFKSYVFLHLDFARERLLALKYLGAVQFVTFEGGPAVIGEDVIASLRLLEAKARSLEAVPAEGFNAGDEVLIKQGPFKGIRARVERKKSQTRLIIQMPLLGQVILADVDAWDVEKE